MATPAESYDVLILGSGQGGKRLAWHLGKAGKNVAVIERRWVGGSCPAVACLPSENEILTAARPLPPIEALELDDLPSHLIVLGGGYVGIEMAQAHRRLGSRVTVLEPGHQLMEREDVDVAQEMQGTPTREGIDILLATHR